MVFEDERERGDLFLSSPITFIAVVAIDFGTTFSGFAFAFNNKDGEKSIHMNKEWGTDQGYSTMKTPTCLLLNPDKSFNSFGYEAQDRYADLEEEEACQYFYFDSFKMILHNNENLNRNTTLEAGNGEHMIALDVFKYSIKYLYTRALEVIQERTGDENFGMSDVQWVLTVPAIWKPAAKQFMREAAYQAGLACPSNPEQILIALEPEAASFYCMEQKMRDFVAESGTNDALVTDTIARIETQYVVVDIGGGTLDVTVHELLENGGIRELYKATGGTFGGQNVNRQFRILLETIFTKSFIDHYARQNPVDWLCLMNDFEVKKRGKRICEGGTTRIRLPGSFISKFPSHKGWDINTAIQQHCSLDEIKVVRNEYLCLEPKVMKQLFNPVMDDIISHLSNLFAQPELSKVKFAFLVGGFADSAVLQKRIKKHFGQTYRILVPQYASLAVVQGAVMFGQKPHKFESRIMTTTYGIRVLKLFLDGLHPESKREIITGIPRCKDVFFKLVKANEEVKVGEKRRFTGFAPVTGEQQQVKVDFYQSDRSDVEFVTDPEVLKAPGPGLVLETPEAWKTKDIEINLLFGGTEIKVTAVNLTSNQQSTVYLDFLASS
ncbi:heat shock 70 kDa protein 12A-like isoform X2 [Stylophora pistillata]|uniref:heat shock 70 kDa protein 12A-like isoform X2 n=1 Tax=Stylophora pistillata TaxID=50429 RepID=UPI000C047B0C|nr:heat shock 70 kDa protein 12A-like isoform X2 [Stylophora pistillata]